MDKPNEQSVASFKTQYLSHDPEYRRRREMGRCGWDEAVSLQQTLSCIDEFLQDAGLPVQARILEMGCGAGNIMLHWAAQGHQVSGVDISPYAIEWAQEQAKKAQVQADFYIADVTKEMELPLTPVDLVIDGHCLHCIIGSDRQIFFRNARKFLKPGGLLHINTMCNNPHHVPSLPHFDPVHRCIVINGIATRYFGLSGDILREVVTAGFQIEKFRVITAQDENDEDCLLVNARVNSLS